MIDWSVAITGIDGVLRVMDQSATAIRRGNDRGIRQLAREAVTAGKPMIPADTGQTRRRLRASYKRYEGLLSARVAVHQPRRHIMRFLEEGTKSHGRHGGPLRAQHIMAQLLRIIQPRVKPTIDAAIELELTRQTLGF